MAVSSHTEQKQLLYLIAPVGGISHVLGAGALVRTVPSALGLGHYDGTTSSGVKMVAPHRHCTCGSNNMLNMES